MQLLLTKKLFIATVLATVVSLAPNQTNAQTIRVTVENLNPSGGLFLTPVWFGLHDGSFDSFDLGGTASASIKAIAEGGDVSGLQSDFSAASATSVQGVVTDPSGFGSVGMQPPLIDAGNAGTTTFTIANPTSDRFFSFASMVIPSNDAFIGNDNPMAYELFDVLGNFNGTRTIDILGNQIWDSGTEENDNLGAAFSADGGTDTATVGGLIGIHPDLTTLLGVNTPVGAITTVPGANDVVARITITAVPEPSTIMLVFLSIAFMGFWKIRRK